jgi:hypothetical protein
MGILLLSPTPIIPLCIIIPHSFHFPELLANPRKNIQTYSFSPSYRNLPSKPLSTSITKRNTEVLLLDAEEACIQFGPFGLLTGEYLINLKYSRQMGYPSLSPTPIIPLRTILPHSFHFPELLANPRKSKYRYSSLSPYRNLPSNPLNTSITNRKTEVLLLEAAEACT